MTFMIVDQSGEAISRAETAKEARIKLILSKCWFSQRHVVDASGSSISEEYLEQLCDEEQNRLTVAS